MTKEQDEAPNQASKAASTTLLTTAFFLPLILAAAYLNMGPTCCGSNCPPPPPPDFTVSRGTDGVVAGDDSFGGFISGDGRVVAFSSIGESLGCSINSTDPACLYLHNLATRETISIPFLTFGRDALDPALSFDGQIVVFAEEGLLFNKHIRLRDLAGTGNETIASDLDILVDDYPEAPTMSTDGRYVAFVEEGGLLDSTDTNGLADVYLKDRQTGDLTRVSMPDPSQQWSGASHSPQLSGDGARLVYQLTIGGFGDIVVLADPAVPATLVSFLGANPSIDALGVLVAYEAEDTGEDFDSIFVYDSSTDTHEKVSIDEVGSPSAEHCDHPIISGNGRFVAFHCYEPMTSHGAFDQVYVRDLHSGTTKLASINATGDAADQSAIPTSFSHTGNLLIIESAASNLGQDPGGTTQVFYVRSGYWKGCEPTAVEDVICDGVDEDCDGQTDEDYMFLGQRATCPGVVSPRDVACFPQGTTVGFPGVLGVAPAPGAESALLREVIWNREEPIFIHGVTRENQDAFVSRNGLPGLSVQPSADDEILELFDAERFRTWKHEISSAELALFFDAQTDTRVAFEVSATALNSTGEPLDLCGSYPEDDQHTVIIRHPDYGLRLWDTDLDGVDDEQDNCPTVYNPGQDDATGEGVGDFCEQIAPTVYFGPSAGKRVGANVEISGSAPTPADVFVVGGVRPRVYRTPDYAPSVFFTYTDVLPGKTRLVAFHQTDDGRRSAVTSFEVQFNPDDINSPRPYSLRIVDVDGQPIAHARVEAEAAVAYSDSNGDVALTAVGRPIVSISARGYLAAKYTPDENEPGAEFALVRENPNYVEGPGGGTLTTGDGGQLVIPEGALAPGQRVHLTTFPVDLGEGRQLVVADVTPDGKFNVPLTLRLPNTFGADAGNFVLGEAEDPSRLRSLGQVVWKKVSDDGSYVATELREARGVGYSEPGISAIPSFEITEIFRIATISKGAQLGRVDSNDLFPVDNLFEYTACGKLELDVPPYMGAAAWVIESVLGAFLCLHHAEIVWVGAPEYCFASADVVATWDERIANVAIRIFMVSWSREAGGNLRRHEPAARVTLVTGTKHTVERLGIGKINELIDCN